MSDSDSPQPGILAAVTDQVIDPREVEQAVWSTADGAMVTFSGIVRDHDGGRDVQHIEYSAHPTAAEEMRRICANLIAEHCSATGADGQAADPRRSVRVGIVHRVGLLEVGDVAVVAVAVAPHRAEAFAACSELIERVKHSVPIWKRQRFTDGLSEWVGAGDC